MGYVFSVQSSLQALLPARARARGGGRARSLYATRPSPPPPRVLKDSGAGAKFFVPCSVEGGTMPLVLKTLKTFFPAKTRNRYYRIHTSIPPCPPDTHTPLTYACGSSGSRAAPPPPPWDPPPCQAANTPPPPASRRPPRRPNSPPSPRPPQVLTDGWGVGRIRTDCSCPPVGQRFPCPSVIRNTLLAPDVVACRPHSPDALCAPLCHCAPSCVFRPNTPIWGLQMRGGLTRTPSSHAHALVFEAVTRGTGCWGFGCIQGRRIAGEAGLKGRHRGAAAECSGLGCSPPRPNGHSPYGTRDTLHSSATRCRIAVGEMWCVDSASFPFAAGSSPRRIGRQAGADEDALPNAAGLVLVRMCHVSCRYLHTKAPSTMGEMLVIIANPHVHPEPNAGSSPSSSRDDSARSITSRSLVAAASFWPQVLKGRTDGVRVWQPQHSGHLVGVMQPRLLAGSGSPMWQQWCMAMSLPRFGDLSTNIHMHNTHGWHCMIRNSLGLSTIRPSVVVTGNLQASRSGKD